MTEQSDIGTRSLRIAHYHRGTLWWVTVRVVLLTLLLTGAGMLLLPRYVARTKLTLLPSSSEIGFASARPELRMISPAALLAQTHVEALLSRGLAEEVAQTLEAERELAGEPPSLLAVVRGATVLPAMGFLRQGVTLLNTGRWSVPDPLTALAGAIQGRTTVENVPGSLVFQVGVAWRDPQTAARVANLLTERYVQMKRRESQEEMRTARAFIDGRIAEVTAELAAVERKIESYRVGEGLYAVNTDLDLGLAELSQYLRDLSATRVSKEQLDARIQALTRYQTEAGLATIAAEREGLETRQASLEKVIAEQMTKLDRLPAKESGLLDLYRARMSKERSLRALNDRLLDTRVAEASRLSTARVIDRAVAPAYPESPLLLKNAAISLPVGLLLATSLILATEIKRRRLRCWEDVETAGRSTEVVPRAPAGLIAAEDRALTASRRSLGDLIRGHHTPRDERVLLRRHLEHLLGNLLAAGRPAIHLCVSLRGGEGTSFLVENLARLAAQSGLKTLVVDADLSDPTLHEAFGKRPRAGLAEVAAGAVALSDVVVSVDEHIDLICAGRASGARGRWDIERCRGALDDLASAYALVLIDSTALRRDPATIRLLPLADELLCVFDATSSYCADVQELGERIASRGAPARWVLNKVGYREDLRFSAEMDDEGLAGGDGPVASAREQQERHGRRLNSAQAAQEWRTAGKHVQAPADPHEG